MPLKKSTSLSNLANIVMSIVPGSSPRRSSPKRSSPKRPPLHPKNVTGKKPEGIAHRGGNNKNKKKNKTQRKRV